MARVKRGVTVRAKHKKILDLAKGYRGRNSKVYTIAKEKVEKGLQYAYRDRRKKKTDFRQLWIVRINAAVRATGMVYSQFINGLARRSNKTGDDIAREKYNMDIESLNYPQAKAIIDELQGK